MVNLKRLQQFILFLFIIMLSCSSEKKQSNQTDSSRNIIEDDFFLLSTRAFHKNNAIFFQEMSNYSLIINNSITIQALVNISGAWIFFIKEVSPTPIKRFILHANDIKAYNIPNYDSSSYDHSIINGYPDSIERAERKITKYGEFYDYYVKNRYMKYFSTKYLNIPILRKQDSIFSINLKKQDDIKELEDIVNKMQTFKNFNFQNKKQIDAIKQLFILTQIQVLLVKESNFINDCNYIKSAFDQNNVFEIRNENDLALFKENIYSETKIENNNIVKYNWLEKNKLSLRKKYNLIEENYKIDSIFYFYTIPDLKLFEFKINTGKNGLVLTKNHLNAEYLWLHNYTAIPLRTDSIFSYSTHSNIKNYDNDTEIVFLKQKKTLSKNALNLFIGKSVDYTWIYYDKIIIQAMFNKTPSETWSFFIKEISNKETNLFYINANDKQAYIIPEYDSLAYDISILDHKCLDSIKQMKTTEAIIYIGENKYRQNLSHKFLELPKIRTESLEFQKGFKKQDDILELENIVNKMEFFDNFNLKNKYQIELLKKLFIITQMQVLTLSENNFIHDYQYLKSSFNMQEVFEIKNDSSYNKYKNIIENEISLTNNNLLYYYWHKNNRRFLSNNLDILKEEYRKKNVFYFYTLPDLMLFKLIVEIKDDKIKLKKEHVNKEHLFFNKHTIITY